MLAPAPITIRGAGAADAAGLFDLHRASVHAFCASAYTPAHMAAWFADRDPGIYEPALGQGRLWLAHEQGHAVGFVGAEPGEVTLLFVSPHATGRAVGSRLLAHGAAQAEAGRDGAVDVVATLNSVAFYRRHGFEVVADEWFERGSPPLRYPVVRMRRSRPLAP